ncbi:MAG TPA: MgtC/SapB family protein [Gemmatimonadaceae bacterium]|nr:MgtC/SapB family protein [Gemmatimonadaceae bacterium]
MTGWVCIERLGMAALLGAVVGLNRNIHRKPAGIRTHAIVSLGAALFTLVSLSIAGTDPSAALRTVQGIVTGIGFVGAGVILHPGERRDVKGLTTAAVIWTSAGLGTACGAGQYVLAAVTVGLVLIVVAIGGRLEELLDRTGVIRHGRQEAAGAGEEERGEGAKKAPGASQV